jgi:hypothetical protein
MKFTGEYVIFETAAEEVAVDEEIEMQGMS